ncbi:MAG TPA: TIGR03118 family protein [Verrucomicrobiae bacterium]
MSTLVISSRKYLQFIERRTLRQIAAAMSLIIASVFFTTDARGQNEFYQTNLVSDLVGMAENLDTNLVNPWGIATSSSSPFWISDNGTGLSTVYNTAGKLALTVAIPPPAGSSNTAAPSGQVFNTTTNFWAGTNASKFIFDTEDGTISAWASGAAAILQVDNSASNSVYKDLALASFSGSPYLYAADFHNGVIDVFDSNWQQQSWQGAFVDTNLPAGFAPFSIKLIEGNLYVAYALQDDEGHDDVAGPGNGYVDVFDTGGNLLQRLISKGTLNSPWAIIKAPLSFGPFGGDLLVGNFGDGKINVFNPVTGDWIDALNDTNGAPIAIAGLWGLIYGNGGSGGTAGTLYFTAGIPGPGNVEDHGLFGSFTPVFPTSVNGLVYRQTNLVSDLVGVAANLDTNLVNPWGIAISSSSPFWISDNGTGLSTVYKSTGALALTVTIPPPAGTSNTAAPTGQVFNNTSNFLVATNVSKFIFDTEDGTISAWASGAAAILEVDNSASNSVYKALALASNAGSPYLYAADFHNNHVDVFDGNWQQQNWSGAFVDTNLPAGFAPFSIKYIQGNLFIAYALQDDEAHDDVAGPGNGYVDVFDTAGNFIKRLISKGALNSPWAMVWAPAGFGGFGGDLLVGNFGDGLINAYNPADGTWLGTIYTTASTPFQEPGLWDMVFGNGTAGGNALTLYFTAGIAGPGNVEDHGLFGALSPINPSIVSVVSAPPEITFTWSGDAGPFEVQMATDLVNPQWTTVTTTTNLSATVTNSGGNAFFRLVNDGN